MEILGRLFGSEAKTKIIRLFLFNPEAVYNARDISSRTNIKGRQTRTVLKSLVKMGLIRKKSASKETKSTKEVKSKTRKIKEIAYFLDQKFPYADTLSNLMFAASIKADDRLAARIMPAGKIKLIIASGIFVRQNDARLDLLVAGDDINEGKLARIIKSIETDIGRDLTYSNLTTADFKYRLDLHDRLIRDVIDFDYIVLVDKIGFEARK
jgi:DNA-binding MarR family transcriptional regulator